MFCIPYLVIHARAAEGDEVSQDPPRAAGVTLSLRSRFSNEIQRALNHPRGFRKRSNRLRHSDRHQIIAKIALGVPGHRRRRIYIGAAKRAYIGVAKRAITHCPKLNGDAR